MVLSSPWSRLGTRKVSRGTVVPDLVLKGHTYVVRTAVKDAIDAEKTIPVLVARLNRKSTALSAASALAHLVKIGTSPYLWVGQRRGVLTHSDRRHRSLGVGRQDRCSREHHGHASASLFRWPEGRRWSSSLVQAARVWSVDCMRSLGLA
jgi:hypothetical protein